MFWLSRTNTQQTRFDPDELVDLIQPGVVEPGTDLSEYFKDPTTKDKPIFEGTLDTHGFTLQRVVKGKKTFIPIITGTMDTNWSGRTELSMHYKMHPVSFWASTVQLVLILGVVGTFLMAGSLQTQLTLLQHTPKSIFLGLSLLFFGGYGTYKFNREVGVWEDFLDNKLRQSRAT